VKVDRPQPLSVATWFAGLSDLGHNVGMALKPNAYSKTKAKVLTTPTPTPTSQTVPIMAAQSPMAGSTQLGCSDFAKIKTTTV
jgi:hypothetical protein